MPTIKVTIDKFGQPHIAAQGFKGAKCELATASLEAALKGEASKRVRTPEFYDNSAGLQTTIKAGG